MMVLFAIMAMFVFAPKVAPELVVLVGLAIVTLAGELTPVEAFSGFGSSTIITIVSTFFVATALRHTGISDRLGAMIVSIAGHRRVVVIATLMLVCATFSSVMNNVVAVAITLPIAAVVAELTKIPNSQLMLPLSFAALLGGMTTLIGTPPNMVASELLVSQGYHALAFHDLSLVGVPLALAGIFIVSIVAAKLIPERLGGSFGGHRADLSSVYQLSERLFRLRVPAHSSLVGKTLAAARFGALLGAEVVAIKRADRTHAVPMAETKLHAGDELIVEGRIHELQSMFLLQRLAIESAQRVLLDCCDKRIGSAVIRVRPGLLKHGHTLRALAFQSNFELLVCGIRRADITLVRDLSAEKLRVDDILLVVGAERALNKLISWDDIEVLELHEQLSDQIFSALYSCSVPPGSPIEGMAVSETKLGEFAGILIVGILRGSKLLMPLKPQEKIECADTLLLLGDGEQLKALAQLGELEIVSRNESVDFDSLQFPLMEVVLSPRSSLIGRTLEQIDFRARYDFHVLGVWRDGRPIRAHISKLTLQLGDALLLQGPRQRIAQFARDSDFLLLSPLGRSQALHRRAPLVFLALALLVILPATGVLQAHVAAFVSALIVLVGGAVSMDEGYREVDWRVVFLIAAILPLSNVVASSGVVQTISPGLAQLEVFFGVWGSLALFSILACAISQLVEASFAVVLLGPLAIEAAKRMHVAPKTFVIATALSASVAFLVPISHRAHLLVMGPGGYRPRDFFAIGMVVTILLLVLIVCLTPIFFPFAS